MKQKHSMNLQKKIIVIAATTLTLWSFLFCLSVRAENEKVHIYIAGEKEQWPLEYYDEKKETYCGILPDLLRRAGEEIGVSITYVSYEKENTPLSLAANLQVDMISTINLTKEQLDQAELLQGANFIALEGEKEISFAYTGTIDPDIKVKIENFLQNVDQKELQKQCLQYAKRGYEGENSFFLFHKVIPVTTVFLIAILLFLPFIESRRRKHLALITYVDDATGAYNFARWKQKYAQQISSENCEHYAVLYLCGGIERVSQIYGYEEATSAVSLISEACSGWVNEPYEGVARFDEFYMVLFVQYEHAEQLKNRIGNLHEDIVMLLEKNNKKYFLELHTGIYQLKKQDKDILKTIQYSKIALEYAKMHYLSCGVYDEVVERETIMKYALEHEAIHGLMHQEFCMYLQPIKDIIEGGICGAEALVRWNNPQRGMLMPEQFLRIMDKKNLTGKLNMEIYRQGCLFLHKAAKKNQFPLLLFNFTADNFGEADFVEKIYHMACKYGIKTSQIGIQLNQMKAITQTEKYMEHIRNLNSFGFNVCIAGLELDSVFFEYIQSGIQWVKIRQEMMQNIETKNGAIILSGVVKMCHDLGKKVLCVGVENPAQNLFLKKMKCEMATGYYYYYPVSPEVFSQLIQDQVSEKYTSIDESKEM